jgi:hypothetical protein
MAQDWFMLNKPRLLEIIDSLAYDTALLETLHPIKSMPHKLDVISAMVRIGVSDGVYSDVERGLVKKTILYWNIPASPKISVDPTEAKLRLTSA